MWREPVLLADASLQDVTDAAKRHELEDARLKLQNDVRTTLLQAWRWWIALATFFILVWWLVPPLLYRHTGTAKDAKVKAITDTRTALLAGLIGVSALPGIHRLCFFGRDFGVVGLGFGGDGAPGRPAAGVMTRLGA
jgi:hypothetical protein